MLVAQRTWCQYFAALQLYKLLCWPETPLLLSRVHTSELTALEPAPTPELELAFTTFCRPSLDICRWNTCARHMHSLGKLPQV